MNTNRIAISVIAIFLSNFGFGQTKEKVIEKYLKAIGGKDNWLNVHTTIDSIILVNYKPINLFNKVEKQDTTYSILIRKFPDKQKFISYKKINSELHPSKWSKSIICYNGSYLWTGSPGKITRQSPDESVMYRNTILSGLPYIFLYDSTAEIEYMGEGVYNKNDCEVLKIKGSNDFFYQLVYFDKGTGLMTGSVGFDTPVKRYSYVRERKWIDNLLIDTMGESYVDGIKTSMGVTFESKINAVIKDSVFSEDQEK